MRFSIAEGLKEENLSTAILQLLLLRSEGMRERLSGLVSLDCPFCLGCDL
jgi:hypothetical protein